MKNEFEVKDDDKFSQTLVYTLDRSVAQIDDLSLQRLKKIRAQALAQPAVATYSRANWRYFSMAASRAMLFAVALFWQQYSAQPFTDADAEFISQDIPPVAQELDDLDMLIAMDDLDA